MNDEQKLFKEAKKLFDEGKLWDALRIMKDLAEKKKNYADFQKFLGVIYYSLGFTDEAIEQFEKALKINPNYIEAHLNMAIVLNDKGDYVRAKEHYEIATKLEKEGGRIPTSLRNNLANTYMKLGDTYFEVGEYEKAKEEYERALELAPYFLDIRTKHARVLMQMGEIDKAIYSLEEVTMLNPKYEEAKLLLGMCYFKKNNKEKAKKLWTEILEKNPENQKVKAYLSLLKK